MRPRRDEEGRIVRGPYSTRDGYQDDPGKPDEVSLAEEQADLVLGSVTRAPREAFEGLLRFVTMQKGALVIVHLGTSWEAWRVEVSWYSIGAGQQKIYAEDRSFDEACVMCRGLLAHAIASGVASP